MEPPDAVSDVAQTESSAQPRPRTPRPAAAAEEERIRVRRETLAVVLERCRKALELLENADLDVDTSSVRSSDGEDDDRREKGEVDDPREEGEGDDPAVPLTPDGSSPPKPSAGDSETDELCALLKSKVESPTFLEKLGNIDISVYPKYHDDNLSWDLISASELWEDKLDDQNNSDEDGYVLVGQEDVVDGIAAFMAAYVLSLKQAKELTPNQLQEALGKAFSTEKKKSRLRKVWEGSQVIYNVASWGATAVGIYQNPMILKAATVAFWSSCRVLSKLL